MPFLHEMPQITPTLFAWIAITWLVLHLCLCVFIYRRTRKKEYSVLRNWLRIKESPLGFFLSIILLAFMYGVLWGINWILSI